MQIHRQTPPPPHPHTQTHTQTHSAEPSPDRTPGWNASLCSLGAGRGAFLKENTLNRRQTYFIFCEPPGFVTHSSICLRALLCMWTHQHRRRPGTPGHKCARLPEKKKCKNKTKHAEEKRHKTAAASHPRKERRREGGEGGEGKKIIKCYVVVLLFGGKMHSVGRGRQPAALCAPGLSRDRCVSTGDHTGVLIRHTDGSVGGAATDA